MPQKQEQGFTLIEVMLAVVLLLTLALPLLRWVLSDTQNSAVNTEQSQAYLRLHNCLEEIRCGMHDLSLALAYSSSTEVPLPADEQFELTLRYLSSSWSVVSGSVPVRDFELQIAWSDILGRTQKRAITISFAFG